MKSFLLLICFILTNNVYSFEINAGTIVNYHYQNNFPKLENKLTKDGRYVISPYYLSVGISNFSIFTSRDCLNNSIYGFLYTKSLINVMRFESSLALGIYSIDQDAWSKVAKTYWLPGGIVPLIGVINVFNLYQSDNYKIQFKNSIFPAIIQNGIFIKFEF